MEEELSRMSQGVRRLQQLQEILGSLPSDRKLLLDKLLVACQQYSNEIAEKRAQLSAQEIAIQAIRDAYVQATDLVFPGVRIVIGKSNYYVRDRLGSGRFCFDGTDVAFVAL